MIKKEWFEKHTLPENSLFFDIETSGFSKYKDTILIVSFAKYFSDSKCKVFQYIAENDERQLLLEFVNALLGVQEVYSFSGLDFDESFIKHRLNVHGIPFDFSFLPFFSIKLLLKHHCHTFKLRHFSREAIEKTLGLVRNHSYSLQTILKEMKKEHRSYTQGLLDHAKEEISTLLSIYDILYENLYQKRQILQGHIFYLFDFWQKGDSLFLHFRCDFLYPYSENYLEDGNILVTDNHSVKLTLLIKHIHQENMDLLLYDNGENYLPLLIGPEKVEENLYFLLKKYLQLSGCSFP